MDNLKRFKKGESLFKEGEANTHFYVIQSGKVSLYNERSGRKIEVAAMGVNQVLGEQGLFGTAKHLFSAEALQETKVMEVAIDLIKSQVNSCPPGVKLLLKSLVDETKSSRNAMRSIKMEQDKAPCPQVSIPRVFSLLNLVARHVGKKSADNPNEITVSWSILKLYASRMFSESFQRMRGVLDILTKLQFATLIIKKNEEGEEELSDATIKNIQLIEDFAEFYQYNYYKGGKAEIIYVDPMALKVAKVLVQVAQPLEVDRKGVVTLDYNQLLEEFKKSQHMELKSMYFDLLEKKGLFVKRKVREKEPPQLLFDKSEFEKTTMFWQILYEIDKWNEKGVVLMKDEEPKAAVGASAQCPQCSGAVTSENKFCPNCGFKLAAAA